MIGSTTALLAATIAFAGGHFLLSHPLRMPLIGALGEKPFRGVYALVAGATFAWMLFAYGAAPRLPLWGKAEWMRAPLIALMLPACILLVCGLATPNAMAVGREGLLSGERAARGIFAVTRHPMNWAFALWALGHLVMNGDSATVILTAGIAFLALVGSWAQERRKAAQMRAAWQGFAARTSFIPLVAIAQGRARFSLRETGYGRIAGGVVLWAILLHVHRYIIGVSPFGG
ncbi:MAG TPA: NnrU family protein [Alphaproteobacteria bacterium]|nr:NnrU family protein [Alphaproteobacteria bacterium]